MNPWLKYLLGRLGLFVVILLVLLPIPQLDLLVKLLAALLLSFVMSWFLLRNWRDEASQNMADAIERRRDEKQRLRDALAGDDQDKSGRSG